MKRTTIKVLLFIASFFVHDVFFGSLIVIALVGMLLVDFLPYIERY